MMTMYEIYPGVVLTWMWVLSSLQKECSQPPNWILTLPAGRTDPWWCGRANSEIGLVFLSRVSKNVTCFCFFLDHAFGTLTFDFSLPPRSSFLARHVSYNWPSSESRLAQLMLLLPTAFPFSRLATLGCLPLLAQVSFVSG